MTPKFARLLAEQNLRKAQADLAPVQPHHDCDKEVRKVNWKTGCPSDGHIWTCSCGRRWQWVEDEAEGGAFVSMESERKGE